jgi:hypothetical protein
MSGPSIPMARPLDTESTVPRTLTTNKTGRLVPFHLMPFKCALTWDIPEPVACGANMIHNKLELKAPARFNEAKTPKT